MQVKARWLQYAAIGAVISFVAGLVLQIPLPQLAISSAMAAGLIFSGYLFQSRGRPEKAAQL